MGRGNEIDMEPSIIYKKSDGIAYIILNRPNTLNSLNLEMVNELTKIWADINQDNEVRVAIVTGTGKAFCAGVDINDLSKGLLEDITPAFPGLGIEVNKPIIAAINGYALGAGLVLAMQSDIRIAVRDIKLGYPEAKVGSSLGIGADLGKYMPIGIAMELLFTSQPITAQRAYEIGFINNITTEKELIQKTTEIARIISANAPLVLKELKILAYKDIHSKYYEGIAIRNQIIRPVKRSEDAQEGLNAFLEKRKPEFKGK